MAKYSSTNNKLFAAALVLAIFVHQVSATCKTPEVPKKVKPATCPRDTLKLGACADLLGAVSALVGSPPSSKCCTVLEGMVDLEMALCLCTAIKANVLGININIPIALGVLVSACEKTLPPGFKCE